VQFQDLTREDKQRTVDNRINVSSELFASCLAKSSTILQNQFSQSSSSVWHEQDRNRAVEVAKLIFCRIVTISDIREMADQVHTPEIEDIKLTQESGDGKESVHLDEIGSF